MSKTGYVIKRDDPIEGWEFVGIYNSKKEACIDWKKLIKQNPHLSYILETVTCTINRQHNPLQSPSSIY